MPHPQKEPLRAFAPDERRGLEAVARAGSERADRAARAKALLAVAAGAPFAVAARERILRELRRPPDRERDGTATWSLGTLQRALRAAPDGLPTVSTWTILHALWDAGFTWQQGRTWCHTGTVVRKRKAGPVEVTDPDA